MFSAGRLQLICRAGVVVGHSIANTSSRARWHVLLTGDHTMLPACVRRFLSGEAAIVATPAFSVGHGKHQERPNVEDHSDKEDILRLATSKRRSRRKRRAVLRSPSEDRHGTAGDGSSLFIGGCATTCRAARSFCRAHRTSCRPTAVDDPGSGSRWAVAGMHLLTRRPDVRASPRTGFVTRGNYPLAQTDDARPCDTVAPASCSRTLFSYTGPAKNEKFVLPKARGNL